MNLPRFGVLALQGAVPEHLRALSEIGVHAISVRKTEQLGGLSGLIIPGGESTTIGDLMAHYGFMEAIREFDHGGGALYGTCAGAILMATEILGGKPNQPHLGTVPMTVQRNGFGRQIESCEVPLNMPILGPEPFRTVFIRAPYIESVEPGVEVLSIHQEKIIAVRYGRHLATAFHPELTSDRRVHRLFVEMALSS